MWLYLFAVAWPVACAYGFVFLHGLPGRLRQRRARRTGPETTADPGSLNSQTP